MKPPHIDSSVAIRILNNRPGARDWYSSQKQLSISTTAVKELQQGYMDRQGNVKEGDIYQKEQQKVESFLSSDKIRIVETTREDTTKARQQFLKLNPTHGTRYRDCLIAETAKREETTLYAMDKHFKSIPGLKTEQPYDLAIERSSARSSTPPLTQSEKSSSTQSTPEGKAIGQKEPTQAKSPQGAEERDRVVIDGAGLRREVERDPQATRPYKELIDHEQIELLMGSSQREINLKHHNAKLREIAERSRGVPEPEKGLFYCNDRNHEQNLNIALREKASHILTPDASFHALGEGTNRAEQTISEAAGQPLAITSAENYMQQQQALTQTPTQSR